MTESSPLQASWSQSGAVEVLSTSARRLLRIWASVSIVLVLVDFSLAVRYVAATGDATSFLSHQLLLPVSTITYVLLGMVVINSRPRNPIGWLFLTVGSAYAVTGLAAGIAIYGSSLPSNFVITLMQSALWLSNWLWLPAIILSTFFVFLLFPDGRLLSPRWRPVVWVTGLGLAMVTSGLALHPGPIESWQIGINPYGLAGAETALEAVISLGSILLAVGGIGSVLAIFLRFRRSRGLEREQMKWLAYSAVIIALFSAASVVAWLTGGLADPAALEVNIALTNLAVLGIAIAAAVAIAGYRLYDIDIILNRTLVYGIMTGVVLLIYGIVVGGAGLLFQSQDNSLLVVLATGLVAILFQPIHARLQRGVNRLVYGRRDEPFEVLAQLGQRLEQTIAPDSAYPMIVETVAQALRLPYVAIQVDEGDAFVTAESYGKPDSDPVSFPLNYQGEVVGRLLVGRRAPGEGLSRADERLLRNIGRQAGAAVYDARLRADLQRSRQQIVTSREEERRRLRRDLHDGLGPSLASLLLETRVLRRMIRDDPAAAENLVDEMQTDIRATIDDIRRVVNELRPPALDDLGLVPALQVMSARLGQGENGALSSLRVHIDAPDDLPSLPAAVEVAAYRIVQEALTNVLHHAHACHATVRLRVDQDLYVEVRDDGVGIQSRREGGLGLISMRERAAELGGRCEASSPPEGGVLIKAMLPMRVGQS